MKNQVFQVMALPVMGGPVDDSARKRIVFIGGVSWQCGAQSGPSLITQVLPAEPNEDCRTAKISLASSELRLSCRDITFTFTQVNGRWYQKKQSGNVPLSMESSDLLGGFVEEYLRKKARGPARKA
jgi:hypothetical protein